MTTRHMCQRRRGTRIRSMTQNLQATARRCSAGERCASYAALGGPAKLSRGNPGPVCYACEERRAISQLRKGAAHLGRSEDREAARGGRQSAEGDGPRPGGGGRALLVCTKGSCQRPVGPLSGGMRLCREHAEAGLARGWQEGRSMWAIICDHNLREALASGEEALTRKWTGLLEEAEARLAQAEANLAAKEARANR